MNFPIRFLIILGVFPFFKATNSDADDVKQEISRNSLAISVTNINEDSSYQFPAIGTLSKAVIRAVPTFENISIYWKPQGGSPQHEALVRYRIKGTKNWNEAQPLWFDERIPDSIGGNTERSKEYWGSIVNLRSGTVYQVEVFVFVL